jgi:ComF family protein
MGMARDLLDVLLPTPCAACGELAGDGALVRLCASCEAQLPRHAWPLAVDIPGLRTGWYLAPYDGVAGELVRRGKYGLREELLVELSRLAAQRAAPKLPRVDMVVPVPSPLGRRLVRGFSVPGLLAGSLARQLGVPQVRLLARRGGARQASVEREARQANVEGVMRLAAPPPAGCCVLLVDDVVTTGATASACARVLLLGGVREVHLFAFASALR